MLTQVSERVKSLSSNFDERSTKLDIPSNRNATEIANQIMWTRQQEARLRDTINMATAILNDLPQTAGIVARAEELIARVLVFRKDQYDSWCREVIEAIEDRNSPIGLETAGRLMELHSTRGTLKVRI